MNKEEFKKDAKKSIDDIYAEIDVLEAKKDKVEADAKIKYHQQLKELNDKKHDLQTKYDELLEASDEKWEEVKSAFSSAKESFKERFKNLTSNN